MQARAPGEPRQRPASEQVHERPYTGAIRAEGRAWVIDAEVQPKGGRPFPDEWPTPTMSVQAYKLSCPHTARTGTFWGPTIDINLNWLLQLAFADGDAYEWRKVRAARSPAVPASARRPERRRRAALRSARSPPPSTAS